jgi:hypothetical protein
MVEGVPFENGSENVIIVPVQRHDSVLFGGTGSSILFGMRLIVAALSLFALAPVARAQTASLTGTVYTTAPLRLHAAPSDTVALATMPAGSAVTIVSCDAAWCSVQYGSLKGYAAKNYLSITPPLSAPAAGRGYVNSRGIWVPSPTRTLDNAPPAGATAQCGDGTYSFSMSRRGTCSHHGGVARWL